VLYHLAAGSSQGGSKDRFERADEALQPRYGNFARKYGEASWIQIAPTERPNFAYLQKAPYDREVRERFRLRSHFRFADGLLFAL
jgi:hypothetical protein